MTNLNQKIWSIIQNEQTTLNGLRKGIINIRALARHYKDIYRLNVSVDAIISSIRRFDLTASEQAEKSVMNKLKGATITTKNNLQALTLDSKCAFKSEWANNCKIILGNYRIKLFAQKEHAEKIAEDTQEHLIEKTDDLSEISIKLRKDIRQTKGVLAKVTNDIFSNDLNIEEVLVCPPEISIYLKTENLSKAHEIMLQLINKE